MKKLYLPVVTTLTFVIVAGLTVWIIIGYIGWWPTGLDLSLTVNVEDLPAVEEVTAGAVGSETATVRLTPGLWAAELAINTEEYDGVRLESIEGFGSVWWSGGPYAFVVGTELARTLDAGDVRVSVGALPGYKWMVTFTRHAAR